MRIINNNNAISIIRKALNLIDPRLIDHGERVAYTVYKMLTFENKYSKEQIINIVILALLHDIGAYKTEEIDNMVQFETKNIWQHSIYGYLFIKKLSPLSNLADSILYHHLDFNKFDKVNFKNKSIASIINLADRIDIAINRKDFNFEKLFIPLKNKKFNGKDIDLFINANKKFDIVGNLNNKTYLVEIIDLLSNAKFSNSQLNQYLEMLIYSIDFRSNVTVVHTINTVSISVEIAKILKLSKIDLEKIYYGALLHDIGKIAIPIYILEKPGSLDNEEMEIMKSHISLTEQILKDSIDNDILKIAIRHHEKLDGSGYPYGLKGDVISISERIVAVADIMSALSGKRSYKENFDKSKVIKILKNMSDENKICKDIVNTVIDNYDLIMDNTASNCKNILDTYNNIKYEYINLYNKFEALNI